MRPTPPSPASRALQTLSVVLPTPQIRPIPVTTTLRTNLLAAFRVLSNVVDGILHGTDFFRLFVGNFDVKGFFEGHNQFDRVQRVRAQIVDKRGAGGDL